MSAGEKLINGGRGEGPNKVQGLEKNKKLARWGRGACLFGTSE